jgi:hypothetical protein
MSRSWTKGIPAALAVAVLFVAVMLVLDINEIVLPPPVRITVLLLGASLAVAAGVAMAYRSERHPRA